MTIRIRVAFLVFVGILLLWFLWLERAILTPFIVAAIFAYIVNPVVNFFTHKVKLPRTVSVVIIYVAIISVLAYIGVVLTGRAITESDDFKLYIQTVVKTTKEQVSVLPDFIRPVAQEALVALEHSKVFSPQYLFELFPHAISRLFSFVIFIFAAFYFLKDGRILFDKILRHIPSNYRIEVEILAKKINSSFAGYLRGQVILVALVSAILFIALSIVGVRFALILAVFSGFAEVVPLVGPVVATVVAAIVVLVTQINNFNLPPLTAALLVALIYFVVRQFQDYFITPYVMGKITKLHPVIILFAVLAGGHTGGILGYLLAVPIAASLKIIFEYSLDKISEKSEIEASETITV